MMYFDLVGKKTACNYILEDSRTTSCLKNTEYATLGPAALVILVIIINNGFIYSTDLAC